MASLGSIKKNKNKKKKPKSGGGNKGGGTGSKMALVKIGDVFLSIGSSKYHMAKILGKLGLNKGNICLASYLSVQGKKCCQTPTAKGHVGDAASAHTFSSKAQTMRALFEHKPYRVDGKAKPLKKAKAGGADADVSSEGVT